MSSGAILLQALSGSAARPGTCAVAELADRSFSGVNGTGMPIHQAHMPDHANPTWLKWIEGSMQAVSYTTRPTQRPLERSP